MGPPPGHDMGPEGDHMGDHGHEHDDAFYKTNLGDNVQPDGTGNLIMTPPDGASVDWDTGTMTLPGEGVDTSMGLPPEVSENPDGTFTIQLPPDATQGADGSIVFPEMAREYPKLSLLLGLDGLR